MKPRKLAQSVLIIPILCCLFAVNDLNAVSAIPVDIIFKQPDGSTFTARLKGDEWFNWVETDDKRVIVRNSASGFYEYAVITRKDGIESLSPSGIIVSKYNSKSSLESLQIEPITSTDLKRMARQAQEKKRQYPTTDVE
ncbi:hypothetical protein KJ966_22145 [bacterium]|nr:hypothetical protein [bacterium]